MELLPSEVQPFGERDFNSTAYTSLAIKSGAVKETLQTLSSALGVLDKELNSQVSLHHEELLHQVSNVKDLEKMLEGIQIGVDTLQQNISRIAKEVKDPTLAIAAKTKQLALIQETCDLLRKIIRFTYLLRKLRGHVQAGNRELAKAAQCIYEIESLRRETTLPLQGIEVVDSEVRWIMKANEDVMNNASRMLMQGMETQNQIEVSTAVQVFFNLGVLKSKVDGCMSLLTERVNKAITNAVSTADENRSNIWLRVEKMTEVMHTCCVQVWHLQRVLLKTKNPTSHTNLIDELQKGGHPSITSTFWREISLKLTQKFQHNSLPPAIENSFMSDFPRLNRNFHEFLKRLQNHYELKQTKTQSLSSEEQSIFLNSLANFRQIYIRRISQRFNEILGKLFIGKEVPEDTSHLTTFIVEEIEIAMSSTEELVGIFLFILFFYF